MKEPPVWAVIVNTIAIVVGTAIGLLLRRGLPEHITNSVMKALGLCTVVIGIQGTIVEQNVLLLIVATVIGVAIGEAGDVDGRINRWTERLTSRFAGKGQGAKIATAFVTSCLIMNVGAMTIVGSLDAGLTGNFNMLYTKSLLDFVAGIMMGAAMGPGVFGSAAFTLVFQGGIVLLSGVIAPFMSDTLIAELSTCGSIMILGLGLNMIEVSNFKILNYLPALIVVPFVLLAFQAAGLA